MSVACKVFFKGVAARSHAAPLAPVPCRVVIEPLRFFPSLAINLVKIGGPPVYVTEPPRLPDDDDVLASIPGLEALSRIVAAELPPVVIHTSL
jgi:hypothetical protein